VWNLKFTHCHWLTQLMTLAEPFGYVALVLSAF
jgi:hypothetical protein